MMNDGFKGKLAISYDTLPSTIVLRKAPNRDINHWRTPQRQNSISEMDINEVYNERCIKNETKQKSVAIGGNHVLFSIILVLELNLPLNKNCAKKDLRTLRKGLKFATCCVVWCHFSDSTYECVWCVSVIVDNCM